MKTLTKQTQNFGNAKLKKVIRVSTTSVSNPTLGPGSRARCSSGWKVGIYLGIAALIFLAVSFPVFAETVTVDGGTIDVETVDNVTNMNVSGNPVWNVPEFNVAESSICNITGITDNASLAMLVGGSTASNIFGTLNLSNLDFILQNVNGINIGASGVVNVNNANFIASTLPLNLTNTNFLAHQYEFEGSSGFILNEGKIQGSNADLVALVANAIENRGTIEVPMGTVALAAGDLVTVGISEDGIVSIGVDPATANELGLTDQIKNSGTIEANGGKVVLDAKAIDGLFDHAINLTGEENATSVIRAEDGSIEFVAEGADVVMDGTVEAPNGTITVQADKDVTVKGTLDASNGTINIEAEGNVDIQGVVTAAQVDMPEAGTVEVVADGVVNISGTVTAGTLEVGPAEVTLEELQGDITDLVIPDSIVIEETAQVSGGLIMTITGEVVEVGSPINAPTVVIRGVASVETRDSGVIEGTSVSINTVRFGTSETPVTVDADSIYLNRLNGEIDIRESMVYGDGIWVRGPPEGDTFNLFYNHNATEVVFDAEKVVLGGTEAIELYGNLTFYNLECTTPDKVIYFEAGKTYTFKGTLDLGPHEVDYPVFMVSSVEGAVWYINIEADEASLQRLAVRDSYNLGDIDIYTTPSANLGNNTGWILNTTYWTGAGADELWSNADNWDPVVVPASTDAVVFNGDTGSYPNANKDSTIDADFNATETIKSLTITDYAGTITAATDLTITGAFSQSGGTFIGGSGDLTFKGFSLTGGTFTSTSGDLDLNFLWGGTPSIDFSAATFDANNGTVKIAMGSTYGNPMTFSFVGDGTFYNLEVMIGGYSYYTPQVKFEAGSTTTIENKLKLAGTSGKRLSLVSSNPGSEWFIDPQGPISVYYVSVADSNNTSLNPIYAISSTNSARNTNWIFPTMYTWVGGTPGAETDWGTAANWDLGAVPGADDAVTIPDVEYEPVLEANASIAGLIIGSGAVLDLAAKDLSLTKAYECVNYGTLRLTNDQTLGFEADPNYGTVEYYGTGTYSSLVLDNEYYNLVISGSGSFTADGAVTVNGDFTQSAGTFTLGGTSSVFGGSFTQSGGTFNVPAGEIILHSGFTQTGGVFTGTYDTMTVGGSFSKSGGAFSGTYNTLEVNNGFNWSGGTFVVPLVSMSCGGFVLTDVTFTAPPLLTVNGNFTVNSGATFIHNDGLVRITASSSLTTSGNHLYDLEFFHASGIDVYFLDDIVVENNLTLSGPNSYYTNEGYFDITVGGDLVSSDTVKIGNENVDSDIPFMRIYLAGDLDLSDTATAVYADIYFTNSAMTSHISGTSNATFYDSVNCTAAGKTLEFEAGSTFTVDGTLYLLGQKDNEIVLRSSVEGSPYNLALTSAQTVYFVDIKDCNASSVITDYGGADLTGNSNVTFNDVYVWSATSDSNWNTADNWTLYPGTGSGVPGANDVVYFGADSTYNCTLDTNVTVTALILDSGYNTGILDTSSYTLTASNLLFIAGGTLTAGGDVTTGKYEQTGGVFTAPSGDLNIYDDFLISGGTFNHNDGNVVLYANSDHMVYPGGVTFYDLTIYQTDDDNTEIILANSFTVANDLTVLNEGDDGTLSISPLGDTAVTISGDLIFTYNHTVNALSIGSLSFYLEGDLIFQPIGLITNNWGSFDSTVIFNGSGDQYITVTPDMDLGWNHTWVIDKPSGTLYLSQYAPASFHNLDLTLTNGIFDLNGNELTCNDYTQTGGTLNVGTGGIFSVDYGGTFTLSGGVFDASLGTIDNNDWVGFTQTGGTFIGGTRDIDFHDFDLTGGSFTSTSGVLNLGGWRATTLNLGNGIFNHNNGTVKIFNSDGVLPVLGSNTFYNLEINTASLTFQAGTTQTIENRLKIESATLRSSSPGSEWSIDPQGPISVYFVDVQDCNNIGLNTIYAVNSTDSDRNINWTFAPTYTWVGGTPGAENDWGTATNWDLGVVPGEGDAVIIPDVEFDPVLDAGRSIVGLVIAEGVILDLGDKDLSLEQYECLNGGTIRLTNDQTLNFIADPDSGTVEYYGTGTYSSLALGNEYNNLIISGTGNFTPSGALTINGTFTQTDGTFSPAASSAVTGAFTLSGGIFNAPAGDIYVYNGADFTGGVFNANGGTFIFDGSTGEDLISAGATFYNLVFTDTGSGDSHPGLVDSFTVEGDLTMKCESPTGHFFVHSFTPGMVITVYGDLLFPETNATGSVVLGWPDGIDLADVTTIDLYGDYVQEHATSIMIMALTFKNDSATQYITQTAGYLVAGGVTIDKSGQEAVLLSNLNLDIDLLAGYNAPLTIEAGSTLYTNGHDLTVSSTFSNNGTLKLDGNETLSITKDTNSGTVEYVGDDTYDSLAYGGNYYDLIISGTGSWTLQSALNVGAAFSFVDGTLVQGARTVTVAEGFDVGAGSVFTGGSSNITVGDDLTIAEGGSFTSTSASLTLGGNLDNSGTFIHNSGTLVMNAAAGTQTLDTGGDTLNNLTHSGAGTLQLITGDLTLSGNFTNSDGTFDANGFDMSVGGNWTNSGIFTHGDGEVTFTAGTADHTITTNDSSFYDLTFDGVGGEWTLEDNLTVANDLKILNGTVETTGFGISIGNTTTIDTSSSANATLNSSQRKSFYDTVNGYYWVFYYTGSDIEYAYSEDGSVWTTDGALGVDSTDYSLTYKNISGTAYTFIALATDSDIYAVKGILGAGSLTVDSQGIALDGSAATPFSGPSIALDADNYIWVAGIKDLGDSVADRYQAYAVRSSNVNDVTAWPAGTAVDRAYAEVNDVIMLPRTGSEMYLISNNGTNNILGYVYNGTSWSAANTGGDLSWFTFPTITGGGVSPLNGAVYSITFLNDVMYLGGAFTAAGSTTLSHIAKLQAGTWSALGSGVNGDVYALDFLGTDLYVGGNFTQAGGAAAGYIAKYDTVAGSWSALDDGLDGIVRSISIDAENNIVAAGGDFIQTELGTTLNRVGKYDVSGEIGVWEAFGTDTFGADNGSVNSIIYTADYFGYELLFMGGSFTSVDGGVPGTAYFMIWAPTLPGAEGWYLDVAAGLNGAVNSIVFSDDVIIAGEFTRANDDPVTPVNHIAYMGSGIWEPFGDGTDGPINSMFYDEAFENLIIGGDFATVDGVIAANNIAICNISDIENPAWYAMGEGTNGPVYAIFPSSSYSEGGGYLGGDFTTADGKEISYIAEIDQWGNWYSLTPTVNAIAVIDSYVYAGGAFSSLGGVDVINLARWDGSVWSELPGGSPDGTVYALEAYSDELYVGGAFSEIGGINANSLAKFTPASDTWSVFTDSGTGIDGVSGGTATVKAIHLGSESGLLYIGGNFTEAGGNSANYAAYWDSGASTWNAISEGMYGGIDEGGEVRVISEFYNPMAGMTQVVFGGSFLSMNGGDDNTGYIASAMIIGVPMWVEAPSYTNGAVNAVAYFEDNNMIYVGGDFTTTGNVFVGSVDANYIVAASLLTGESFPLGDGTNGGVTSLYFSGDDLYVGGRFTSAGGDGTIQYIAKYDTTVGGNDGWSALGDGVNAPVLALTGSGTAVYAGGMFTTAGGTDVDHIAKYDLDWASVTESGVSGGQINALAFVGDTLYLGGAFTTVGGSTSNYLAGWDGSSWITFGTDLNGEVLALYGDTANGNLFVGGDFTTVDGITANHIAVANVSDPLNPVWMGLGSGGIYGVNGTVRCIGATPGKLYVGGDFVYAADGITELNHIGVYDVATSGWSAFQGGVNGNVYDIFVIDAGGGAIVLAPVGEFTATITGSIPMAYAGIYHPMLGGWMSLPDGGLNDVAYSIEFDGGSGVFIGGAFTASFGGATALNHIAFTDVSTWSPLGAGTDGPVYSLSLSGTNLLVGGEFTTAGGIAAANAAIADVSDFPAAVSWSAAGSGTNGAVYAIVFDGEGTPSIGGNFTESGTGAAMPYLGSYSYLWSAMGEVSGGAATYGLNAEVIAVTVYGTDIYIGGAFTHVGDIDANRIAKYDTLTGTWSALGDGIGDGYVYQILVESVSGDVYAGGSFTQAGGSGITAVARWDGSSWNQLGEGLSGAGALGGPLVYDLAQVGSDIYVAGSFTSPGDGIVKYTPGTDTLTALGSGLDGGAAFSLEAIGTSLYVGGYFMSADSAAANCIAKYDTVLESWSALGGGITGAGAIGVPIVYTIEGVGTDLYVGGQFSTAGVTAVSNVAKYDTLIGGNDGWSALGDGITGGSGDLGAIVLSIVSLGDHVYFGGSFGTAGNTPASNIASYDTTSSGNDAWAALGDGVSDELVGSLLPNSAVVFRIGVLGNDLYIGGDFTKADGKDSTCFAKYGLAAATGTDSSSEISAVSDSTGNIHMIYTDSSDDLKYKFYDYATESWQSEVALQNGTVRSPSLSIDATDGSEMYAFWIDSNVVKVKRGVTPYEAADWDVSASSLYSIGTNANLISTYDFYDAALVGWTNGAANPYSVMAGVTTSGQRTTTVGRDLTIGGGTYTLSSAALVIAGEFLQTGGTFDGATGSADIAGDFEITGGTFTAPQLDLSLASDFLVSNAATFVHNDGLVTLDTANAATVDVTGVEGGTLDLWDFTITGGGKVVSFGVKDTFNVLHSSTFIVTGEVGNEVTLQSADRTAPGDVLGADSVWDIGLEADGWNLSNVVICDANNANYDAVGFVDLGGVTSGLVDGGNTWYIFSFAPTPVVPDVEVPESEAVDSNVSDVTDSTLNDIASDVSGDTEETTQQSSGLLPDINDWSDWFGETLGDMDLLNLVDLVSPFTMPIAFADVGTPPSVAAPDIMSPDTITDMMGDFDAGLDNGLTTPGTDAITGGGIENILSSGIEQTASSSEQGLGGGGIQGFLQGLFEKNLFIEWLHKPLDDLFKESMAKTLKTKVRVSEGSVYVLDRVNNMSLIQRGEARMVYYKSRPQAAAHKARKIDTPPVSTPAADEAEESKKGLRYGTLKNPGKDVFVKGRDGEWIPAKDGMVVLGGDEIKTAKENTVELELDDGKTGKIKISGGTMMRINQLAKDPGTNDMITLLDLALGKMLVKAEPLKGNSKFEVRTPTALTGVRGTIFEVSVEPRAET